jgi:hypothetical protein
MRFPRSPRWQAMMAVIVLGTLMVLGATAVMAQSGLQLFSYTRVSLPVLSNPLPTAAPTPTPAPAPANPRIVAWLDIPSEVRLEDRLQVVVNIKNESSFDFNGRTRVVIPYEGASSTPSIATSNAAPATGSARTISRPT